MWVSWFLPHFLFFSFSLRMDFEDFCQHFTDVVVCRLVERTLLWPRSRWREVSCYGEWVLPPPTHGAPPPTVLQSNSTLTLSKSSNGPGGTKQRGNRKEDRLGESQQEGRKRGRSKPDVNKVTVEKGGGKVNGVWKVELDKRSRCGGCINHRDTFLHNPQVNIRLKPGFASAHEC